MSIAYWIIGLLLIGLGIFGSSDSLPSKEATTIYYGLSFAIMGTAEFLLPRAGEAIGRLRQTTVMVLSVSAVLLSVAAALFGGASLLIISMPLILAFVVLSTLHWFLIRETMKHVSVRPDPDIQTVQWK